MWGKPWPSNKFFPNEQFPLRFAMELQPTGDVSEYSATITYEVLKEGKDSRNKVDSLVVTLKAEGKSPRMF